MKIPISWLTKYVDIEKNVQQLGHDLTMAGLEVAGITLVGEGWDEDNLVVGEIVEISPHPDADKLRLPTIHLGNDETIRVVCGAPNIEIGQKIAFAKEGTTLVNPRNGKAERLKATVIRGVESKGMVCSALELGLSDEHDGILVLDPDIEVGLSLSSVLSDQIIETELTPNRPDCLSIIGTAYEVAALQSTNVREPIVSNRIAEHVGPQTLSVQISDPGLCKRYVGAVIKGINISESPQWLKDALEKSNQRSINNLVDITNFVMLEYGQPLHAFDLNKIDGGQIKVRVANAGELIETLDGQTRTLKDEMLVIADKNNPIGLAGIMGGANTEVDSDTKDIFLEAANFDATSIRETRGALGLNTEASYRFERRLRPELTVKGINRAIELITSLCGGELGETIYDVYPNPSEIKSIRVTGDRLEKILGARFHMEKVWEILERLGFTKVAEDRALIDLIETIEARPYRDSDSMNVFPPEWRSDIEIEDDVIEEFARIYGYDNLPMQNMASELPSLPNNQRRLIRESVRDKLVNAGLNETISYSVANYSDLLLTGDNLEENRVVRLQNPMDATRDCLRNSLRANVLETACNNRKLDQQSGLKIFEIGNTFTFSSENSENKLPDETENMVAILTGPRVDFSIWSGPVDDFDFFDAKGAVESALDFRLNDLSFEKFQSSIFSNSLSAEIKIGPSRVGIIGLLNQQICERYELNDSPVYLIELDLEQIYRLGFVDSQRYVTTSKYPSSSRDIALISPINTTSSSIKSIILKNRLVLDTFPIDMFDEPKSESVTKAITYRVIFQSDSQTLSTEDIDKAQNQILKSLEYQLATVSRY